MARTKQTSTRKLSVAANIAKKTLEKKHTPSKSPRSSNSTVTSGAGVKKPHRYKPGTVALREIKRYQKSTETLVPHLPFERVLREVGQKYKADLRWTEQSIWALQEASEALVTEVFAAGQVMAIHGKRVGINREDMYLALCMVNKDLARDWAKANGLNYANLVNHGAKISSTTSSSSSKKPSDGQSVARKVVASMGKNKKSRR